MSFKRRWALMALFAVAGLQAQSQKLSTPSGPTALYYTCFPVFGDKEPFPLVSVYYEKGSENGQPFFKRVMLRNKDFQNTVKRYDWQESSFLFVTRWNPDGSIQLGKYDEKVFKNRTDLKSREQIKGPYQIQERAKDGKVSESEVTLIMKTDPPSEIKFGNKTYKVWGVENTWLPKWESSDPMQRIVEMYSPDLKTSLEAKFYVRGGLFERCELSRMVELELINVR